MKYHAIKLFYISCVLYGILFAAMLIKFNWWTWLIVMVFGSPLAFWGERLETTYLKGLSYDRVVTGVGYGFDVTRETQQERKCFCAGNSGRAFVHIMDCPMKDEVTQDGFPVPIVPTPAKEVKEDWEKEFDREFSWLYPRHNPEQIAAYKAFIKSIEAKAYERGKNDYYSAIDVHEAIDAVIRAGVPGEVSALHGEDGKYFSRVVAKAMEAPFPAVAMQHVVQKVDERARIAQLEEDIAEIQVYGLLTHSDLSVCPRCLRDRLVEILTSKLSLLKGQNNKEV